MGNLVEVRDYIDETTGDLRRLFAKINKEKVAKEETLSDEQMEELVTANARAEIAQKLKQAVNDPEVTTNEKLVETIRESRKLCLIRKNLAHEGVLRHSEEAKLYFLNIALYKAKKTEQQEKEEIAAWLATGNLETADEIVKRINEEEDYR